VLGKFPGSEFAVSVERSRWSREHPRPGRGTMQEEIEAFWALERNWQEELARQFPHDYNVIYDRWLSVTSGTRARPLEERLAIADAFSAMMQRSPDARRRLLRTTSGRRARESLCVVARAAGPSPHTHSERPQNGRVGDEIPECPKHVVRGDANPSVGPDRDHPLARLPGPRRPVSVPEKFRSGAACHRSRFGRRGAAAPVPARYRARKAGCGRAARLLDRTSGAVGRTGGRCGKGPVTVPAIYAIHWQAGSGQSPKRQSGDPGRDCRREESVPGRWRN
jgi:hypothetical protein